MIAGASLAQGPIYTVRNGAVVVPADFVGMHFRGWPLYNAAFWASVPPTDYYPKSASPAPAANSYKSYRTHDSGYCWWNQIETSASVYNWTYIDQIVSAHKARGVTVIWCGMGTPDFYLSPGNPRKGTNLAQYCYPDSTSPNGLTGLSNFITALFTRYNTSGGGWAAQANGGGTNWTAYGRGIDTLEYWNEPGYGDAFWLGTVGQLIDVSYLMKTAARAVDPTVKVTSPGFIGSNTMQIYMQASGTINTGVTGLSLCDEVAMHTYDMGPPGVWYSYMTQDIVAKISQYKIVAGIAGAGALPMSITEIGINGGEGSPEYAEMMAKPASWRYEWYARVLMHCAANGMTKCVSYAWDVPYLLYPQNATGVGQAIADVHANVSGKTIRNAYYYNAGPYTLLFSDGSSLTV